MIDSVQKKKDYNAELKRQQRARDKLKKLVEFRASRITAGEHKQLEAAARTIIKSRDY